MTIPIQLTDGSRRFFRMAGEDLDLPGRPGEPMIEIARDQKFTQDPVRLPIGDVLDSLWRPIAGFRLDGPGITEDGARRMANIVRPYWPEGLRVDGMMGPIKRLRLSVQQRDGTPVLIRLMAPGERGSAGAIYSGYTGEFRILGKEELTLGVPVLEMDRDELVLTQDPWNLPEEDAQLVAQTMKLAWPALFAADAPWRQQEAMWDRLIEEQRAIQGPAAMALIAAAAQAEEMGLIEDGAGAVDEDEAELEGPGL